MWLATTRQRRTSQRRPRKPGDYPDAGLQLLFVVDRFAEVVEFGFAPGGLNCFEIGTLAVNNHQHNEGSFSADILCSFASDPPCTEAVSVKGSYA